MEPIYLDHAATTPLHPTVIQAMTENMQTTFGNPSSIHQFGRKAHGLLEEVRQTIAESLQAKPHEIIFNSGGTEGDNTAILAVAFSRQKEGKHIITTAIEHPAVLRTMEYLETLGFEVTYLPVNENGQISMDQFKKSLREETILVSMMYGNNEIGNRLPIAEVGAILKNHSAIFHTDAVQAYGSEVILPHELGIDLLSISAHKINGPKGVGFLFKSDAIQLPPLLHGGEQEEKRRAGTENLAGIIGMGTAVSLLTSTEKQARKTAYQSFQTIILKALEEANIDFSINGEPTNRLAHVLNLHLKGIPSDLLLMHLDLRGIAISTGSACTAGTVDPSYVLTAMYGENSSAIKESIRISFGYGNTPEEIATFSEVLVAVIQQLKK